MGKNVTRAMDQRMNTFRGWYRVIDAHKELVRNLEAKVRLLPPGFQLTTPQRMILQEYLDQVIKEGVGKTAAKAKEQAEATFAEIRDYIPYEAWREQLL